MKKKQKISLYDLGRIPTSERTNTTGYETRAEFFAREAREEQERREAPLKKVQSELNSALRENAETIRAFYSRPVEKLSNASASVAPVDFGLGTFPGQTEEPTQDEILATLSNFGKETTDKGFDLSTEGWRRIFRYAKLQAHLQKFALTPEFLQACLVRLGELQCFAPNEILKGEIPKRQIEKPSEPELTHKQMRAQVEAGLDEFPDTREGRAMAMQIIGKLYSLDVQNMFLAWDDQLRRDWHTTALKPKITAFAGDFFMKNNLNPLTPKNYDKLRCVLSKLGYLGPLDYRTKEEKLAEALENSDLNDREVRQALNRHTREILEDGVGKKGAIVLR